MQWGLIDPERLPTRRRRTLELTGVIRHYNDLAVPGLGGLWFIKQIALATLGVRVAHEVRSSAHSPIVVTNAIEALSCALAFERNRGMGDARLRGSRKLSGRKDLSFSALSKAAAYVTQPMRMAVSEPLKALGFVETPGSRFNSFSPARAGDDFVDAVFGQFKPRGRSVVDYLIEWVRTDERTIDVRNRRLVEALSPDLPVIGTEGASTLREHLVRNSERRRNALAWIEHLSDGDRVDWGSRAASIDEAHWRDMVAGAAFNEARDDGIACIETVEAHLQRMHEPRLDLTRPLPAPVRETGEKWRRSCARFEVLAASKEGGAEAEAFCAEAREGRLEDAIGRLVTRDADTLRWETDQIVGTAAFRARFGLGPDAPSTEESQAEDISSLSSDKDDSPPDEPEIDWPVGRSQRLPQLRSLSLDLRGELHRRILGEPSDA